MLRDAKLHDSLIRAFLEHIPDAVYFKDRDSRFVCISRSLATRFGLKDPVDAIGKTDFDMFTREHATQAFADEQKIIRTGEPIIEKEEKETWEGGRENWVLTTKLPWRDLQGNIIGTMGISRDITERKYAESELQQYRIRLEELVAQRTVQLVQANELLKEENEARKRALEQLDAKAKELARVNTELKNLSLIDDLTGLYNRRGFLTFADHQIKSARRDGQRFSIAFVDVDKMKEINDTWGHYEGNLALIDTSDVLRKSFRSYDVVARIGGDEFAICVAEAYPQEITTRINEQLEVSTVARSRPYHLSLSVGVESVDLASTVDISTLLSRADELMYQEKRKKTRPI